MHFLKRVFYEHIGLIIIMKLVSFAVFALLNNLSQAAFNQVGNNVVRVELTKHHFPSVEMTETELNEEVDNIIIEDTSYVMLRQKQA